MEWIKKLLKMEKGAEIKVEQSDCKSIFFFFVNQALKLGKGVKSYCILLHFLNVFTYLFSFKMVSRVA